MHLETTPATLVQIDTHCDRFPDLCEGTYTVGERIDCESCGRQHTVTGAIATAIAENITIID